MRRSVVACSLMSLAVGFLAGCPDRSIDKVDPLQGRVEAKDIPVNINRDLDLLFLIDDSPSMADKQANLADNFGKFIDVLNSIPGGLPNVHIGVVTSDMGTQGPPPSFGPTVGAGLPGACAGMGKDGVLQTFGAPITGNFIVDTKDPTNQNYDPTKITLAKLFGNIAQGAGNRGCGFEQHLSAMQRALVNPANGGFLRNDPGKQAYLAKINGYVDFLKKLKSDPNKVIVAGIIGTTDRVAVELRTPPGEKTAIPALAHSCSYVDRNNQTEVADPPIRIKAFLDQFPNRSTFVPICQKDLSGGLQQIGDLLKTVIGDPCIEGKLQNFGTAAAPIYDCSVSSVENPGSDMPKETIMAECPKSGALPSTPCWHIVTDTMKCPMTPDHLVLKIENDNQFMMSGKDVHVLANCVTQSQ